MAMTEQCEVMSKYRILVVELTFIVIYFRCFGTVVPAVENKFVHFLFLF